MKNNLKLVAFTLCLAFFVFIDRAPAVEIEGVIFADNIIVDNVELQVRGVALLKYMLFFKGYVGAFYLPGQIHPADVTGDMAKHLVLEYFHDIKKEDFQKSTTAIIKNNLSEADYQSVKDRVQQFNALYRDVNTGDRYSLTYIPGKGTTLSLNKTPLGTIPGHDFSVAVFSIWLGENPIEVSFKNKLLGKK